MSERKYRVSGPAKVKEHAPGSVFSADFDEAKEARLIAAGLIERVRANARTREADDDAEQNEGGDE
jgi:hypothetical protein